jgi:hypothetical protein
VERETRESTIDSIVDYWEPIETGVGSMPQAYVALSETDRRAVRAEVSARLAQFESNGRLVISVEMLIRAGERSSQARAKIVPDPAHVGDGRGFVDMWVCPAIGLFGLSRH